MLSRLAVLLPALIFLPGCAFARAAEGPLLTMGEAACESFLPVALPGYGALDILACKGAEAALATLLGAVAPPAAGSPLGGGGAAFVSSEPHRPLRVAGNVWALVRADASTVARAQARLDARTK